MFLWSTFYESLLSSTKKWSLSQGEPNQIHSEKQVSYLPTVSIKTAWKRNLVDIFFCEDTLSNDKTVFMKVIMEYLKIGIECCNEKSPQYTTHINN